jgi:hypothetical protein
VELEVDVLRGGLRRLGDRVRLRVELMDGATGLQVWSERFETAADAVFTVQDEVVGRIATSMVARLEEETVHAALRRPPASLAAYELTLRGLAELRAGALEADEAARALFRRALALDPHYARAETGLSLSHFNEWSCQHWSRFAENGRLAYQHAHRALALDDRDAMVHLVIGRIQLYHRELDRASWYFDRALALSPNDADLFVQLAICEVFMGRPDVALGHVERAMRRNPYHPPIYAAVEGLACFSLRRYERALAGFARGGPAPYVNTSFYVAVTLAYLGRLEEGAGRDRPVHRAVPRADHPRPRSRAGRALALDGGGRALSPARGRRAPARRAAAARQRPPGRRRPRRGAAGASGLGALRPRAASGRSPSRGGGRRCRR